MTVKLVVLKSGEHIISDIKEGVVENSVVCYILEKPHSILINGPRKISDEKSKKVNISLQSWPMFSIDDKIEVVPDWVVTIVEPNHQIKEMYEKKVLNHDREQDQINNTDESTNSDQ
jgi:hypothetical protein